MTLTSCSNDELLQDNEVTEVTFSKSSSTAKSTASGQGKQAEADQFSDYYGGVGGCQLFNVFLRDIETENS